ncbi:MAG TPA: hypothetical protein VD999_06150 [Vitreimonas sp.]|nr:hypothetical protein [Vitreimonas sp.]
MVSRLDDFELTDITIESSRDTAVVDPEKLLEAMNMLASKINETLDARSNIWDRLRDALSDTATST